MTLPMLLLLAVTLTPPTAIEYKQPQLAASSETVGVVFGSAGSIYFAASQDHGATFGEPGKIADVPGLNLGNHRGPRVAFTPTAIVVSAINGADLLSWRSTDGGKSWKAGAVVNDVAKAAREGLHAMTAGPDGRLFATWLDLRGKGTRLYGAFSTDDGATWSKNVEVYQSPEGTICQCCHPSLAFTAAGAIEVMWRNAMGGNRDMYLASSKDGGKSFSAPVKLGEGSWRLDACPMDGGGLTITPEGKTISSWRRGEDIYVAPAGGKETVVHAGKNASIASSGSGVYVAWSSPSGIFASAPGQGEPLKLDSEGGFVQLMAIPGGKILASWERKGTIQFHMLP